MNNASSLPLQRRFEINAHTFPGAPAIKSGGKMLTYGELDTQADELALHLQQRGLVPGSFCIVKLKTSMAKVRVILAILKAGGAYLQFDPELAPQHEAVVIDILEPSFLVVHEHREPGPQAGNLQVIECDDEAQDLPYGWPDEARIGAGTPACALATSTLDDGLCVWMRTHQALAFPEREAGDDGRSSDQRPHFACRDSRKLWQVLSKGALLTIPYA